MQPSCKQCVASAVLSMHSCSVAHTGFRCLQVALQDHFARMLQISSGARLKPVSYEPVSELHAQTVPPWHCHSWLCSPQMC